MVKLENMYNLHIWLPKDSISMPKIILWICQKISVRDVPYVTGHYPAFWFTQNFWALCRKKVSHNQYPWWCSNPMEMMINKHVSSDQRTFDQVFLSKILFFLCSVRDDTLSLTVWAHNSANEKKIPVLYESSPYLQNNNISLCEWVLNSWQHSKKCSEFRTWRKRGFSILVISWQ